MLAQVAIRIISRTVRVQGANNVIIIVKITCNGVVRRCCSSESQLRPGVKDALKSRYVRLL